MSAPPTTLAEVRRQAALKAAATRRNATQRPALKVEVSARSTALTEMRHQAALKAVATRRLRQGAQDQPSSKLEARLMASMRGAINFARRRQALKAAKGRPTVQVTVTVEQLMAKLRQNRFCCALTGLPFWNDEADRFGPTMPSLDRIDCDGDYSDENIRVVLLGVNSLRGRGSEADMYRIAEALVRRQMIRPDSSSAMTNLPDGQASAGRGLWPR